MPQVRYTEPRPRDRCFRIPMDSDSVRSLNLSTSVGIVVYEALRQTGWRSSEVEAAEGKGKNH